MDRILIRDLTLMMSIGIHEAEKQKPQRVTLNIDITIKENKNRPDGIEHTVCYEKTIREIEALAGRRHFNLIETLIEDIAALILEKPDVTGVEITAFKPDIMPGSTRVGARISRTKR